MYADFWSASVCIFLWGLNVFLILFTGISNVKSRESLVMSSSDLSEPDPFGAAPFNLGGKYIFSWFDYSVQLYPSYLCVYKIFSKAMQSIVLIMRFTWLISWWLTEPLGRHSNYYVNSHSVIHTVTKTVCVCVCKITWTNIPDILHK